MTAEDVRLLSPELAVAGVALLVVLLDLVVRRKGLLALVSAVGLLIPFGLSIWLWIDVDDEPGKQLVGIFGTLTVDQFALFFKFLVLSVAGLIVLASADYVRKMERYQGEYYALILFSATGMMLLAAAGELISIYISPGAYHLAPRCPGRLLDERPLQRSWDEVLDSERDKLSFAPLRNGPLSSDSRAAPICPI